MWLDLQLFVNWYAEVSTFFLSIMYVAYVMPKFPFIGYKMVTGREPQECSLGASFNTDLSERKAGELPNYRPVSDHMQRYGEYLGRA